ncbi:hypothetical protein A5741_17215 [Mycolicibacterium conceptionense]|nr:hypothetical protein A5741_17215 [Mycolicibacterium conceptionense]
MSIAATVGIPVITGVPTCIHDGFVALENLKVDQRFLLYLLKASESKLRESGQSGSQMNVNTDIVKGLHVCIPVDLREQHRIASALWDIDELIATLEHLIAKKQAIKQGTMQQLLSGHTRLPGFKGEWSGSTVGEVSEFLTGYPFESGSFAAAGIRLIRGSNVKRGEIDWSPEIAMYWAQCDPALRAVALRAGDIVVAMDGALVGRSFARITDVQLPAYLVQRVARLRGKAIDQDLLYQWIGSQAFTKHVDDVKTHTAIPHISPRDIRDFKISIPVDVDEQRAIADVLVDADQQIELLKSRLVKARAIKTGMMQQLLTGRTRLPVEAAS